MRLITTAGLILLLTTAALAQDFEKVDIKPDPQNLIDIPYTKFTLSNGLTLIVHEDKKAPIVAVNVWYHVGSKNEKKGKTGFAHLFEHLMFNGSENFNDDYFQVLEGLGATDLNGTTNTDRTNYFQNVSKNNLDAVLWMESDRMGHLLGAVDQERLDEQRGVVQNEKRQGENQPYGKMWNVITENTWPEGHPYSWTVIGSMEDLNAASLDDVKQWFSDYYGAANAVITIAGDIDPETAKAKVEKYFGDIPAGIPVGKHESWVVRRSGEHRMTMEDRVPQSRVVKVWNIPESGHRETIHLEMVADILASGKNSRLFERLVYIDQTASDVVAFIDDREIASQMVLWATALPGGDLSKVEAAVEEELIRFLQDGPTEKELERIKTQTISGFIRGVERIGGFGGKSDVLAANEVYHGSPDAYKTRLATIQSATTADLQEAAMEWLKDGQFVLEIHPFPEYTTAEAGADRSAIPTAGPEPAVAFPDFQRTTLSNGMKVVLAERHDTPLVEMNMMFDAGYVADDRDSRGLGSMVMSMLDEGTTSRNSLEIAEEQAMLGAQISSGNSLDASHVSLSSLSDKLDPSLDLYADIILNANFPDADLERLRTQRLAQIEREQSNPVQMAVRVFPKLLYGEEHPYGVEFTGSGTQETVTAITRTDLVDFHQRWFRPNNATLVVAGDITMDDLVSKLEARFGSWERGNTSKPEFAAVDLASSPKVYLMDKPGAEQSIIIAGHTTSPKSDPNDLAITTMNSVLGGMFTSRLNMNLREDKGWSYGVSSLILDARGQRPFLAFAPVQTDKTSESMAEIKKELEAVVSTSAITADEMKMAVNNMTLSLPGQWETISSVLASANEVVEFGLEDSHYQTYAEAVRSLDIGQVNSAAKSTVHPESLVWVIVGDRAKIESGIRDLGFGEISLLDSEGNAMD